MRNVRATRVLMHLNSQLVIQQVKGTFEIKDEKLRKYCEAVEHNREHFVKMQLKQVHWAKNHWANKLAWLASSFREWITQEIVAQVELLH